MLDATTEDKGRRLPVSFVEVSGLRVRVFSGGSGSPLLLLHGWGASSDSFAPLIPELSRKHSVVAFDFPGFGKSEAPPAVWGVNDFVSLTQRLMVELGVRQPDVIAHSFGGRVAIKLGAQDPPAIGRLVLVGVPGIRGRRKPKYYAKAVLVKSAMAISAFAPILRRASEALIRVVASRDYLEAGVLRGTFVKVVNEDVSGLLKDIKSPVLLVWGANDEEVPIAVGRAMARLIPAAMLAEVPNSGHFCFLEQQDYFRLVVERFLNGKR